MLIKRLPLLSLAIFFLSSSFRKISSSLVRTVFTSIFLEIFFSSLLATSRATSFSKVPLYPTAPGSFPPCPGSITIVENFHFFFSFVKSTLSVFLFNTSLITISLSFKEKLDDDLLELISFSNDEVEIK